MYLYLRLAIYKIHLLILKYIVSQIEQSGLRWTVWKQLYTLDGWVYLERDEIKFFLIKLPKQFKCCSVNNQSRYLSVFISHNLYPKCLRSQSLLSSKWFYFSISDKVFSNTYTIVMPLGLAHCPFWSCFYFRLQSFKIVDQLVY